MGEMSLINKESEYVENLSITCFLQEKYLFVKKYKIYLKSI